MADLEGSFIWYELMTGDPVAAAQFYTDVIGWGVGGFDGSMDYRVFTAAGEGVAGLLQLPAGAPNAPGWFGYIHVADVDGKALAIAAAGGAIHMPATDIDRVGRIAMVADPQGLIFYVMRPKSPDPNTQSHAFSPDRLGSCAWNELVTDDPSAAMDFYVGQFGWSKGGAMPMGDMGDYQFVEHGGGPIGAMMAAQPSSPTRWTFYFRVTDVDAATARIEAGGGAITTGPHDVPGGGRIVTATDPQGAAFALVSGGTGELV